MIEHQDELEFDWDRANIRHLARHRVRPDEAEQALRKLPVEISNVFRLLHRHPVIAPKVSGFSFNAALLNRVALIASCL